MYLCAMKKLFKKSAKDARRIYTVICRDICCRAVLVVIMYVDYKLRKLLCRFSFPSLSRELVVKFGFTVLCTHEYAILIPLYQSRS